MALGTPDPLERARRQLREDEEQPQWLDLSDAIMARVRGISWPAARILTVDAEGQDLRDEHGSRTYVSGRVVRDALRRALTTATVEPRDIELDVEDDLLVHLDLELVATYAQDLQQVGVWARVEAVRVLAQHLGERPGFDPDTDLTVTITDLHEHEAS